MNEHFQAALSCIGSLKNCLRAELGICLAVNNSDIKGSLKNKNGAATAHRHAVELATLPNLLLAILVFRLPYPPKPHPRPNPPI